MSILSQIKKIPTNFAKGVVTLFAGLGTLGLTMSRLSYGVWAYVLAMISNAVRNGMRMLMALPVFVALARKYLFAFLAGVGAELIVLAQKMLGVIVAAVVEGAVIAFKILAAGLGFAVGMFWAMLGGGAEGFRDVMNFVFKLTGGKEEIGSYYNTLFRKIGGDVFLFSQFLPVFRAYCEKINVRETYDAEISTASLGSQPYWEQNVARKAFETASGYEDGFRDAIQKDFKDMNVFTRNVLSAPFSLIMGLCASVGLTAWYPVVGFMNGFNSSEKTGGLGGLPGALLGATRGLYKGLTFAFRNAADASDNTDHSLLAFFRSDMKDLEVYSLVVFEEEIVRNKSGYETLYSILPPSDRSKETTASEEVSEYVFVPYAPLKPNK